MKVFCILLYDARGKEQVDGNGVTNKDVATIKGTNIPPVVQQKSISRGLRSTRAIPALYDLIDD